MLSVQSVREHIQKFLGGAESLDDFEDWLVDASWNLRKAADPEPTVIGGKVWSR